MSLKLYGERDGCHACHCLKLYDTLHYRHHGLGTRLLARLLDELAHVETVSLFCDPDLAPFYLPHGFRPTTQLVMHRLRPSLNAPRD